MFGLFRLCGVVILLGGWLGVVLMLTRTISSYEDSMNKAITEGLLSQSCLKSFLDYLEKNRISLPGNYFK